MEEAAEAEDEWREWRVVGSNLGMPSRERYSLRERLPVSVTQCLLEEVVVVVPLSAGALPLPCWDLEWWAWLEPWSPTPLTKGED